MEERLTTWMFWLIPGFDWSSSKKHKFAQCLERIENTERPCMPCGVVNYLVFVLSIFQTAELRGKFVWEILAVSPTTVGVFRLARAKKSPWTICVCAVYSFRLLSYLVETILLFFSFIYVFISIRRYHIRKYIG